MIWFRRTVLAAALALVATAPTLAQSARVDLNLDDAGLMIRGYDPVAYFTLGAPTKGLETLKATHDGGTYLFASAEHRDLFLKEPARYVPAYGGYCALGTAMERKFDGDPNLWKIVDGKLYLNVNAQAAARWQQDIPGFIKTADVAWPKIKDTPADQLK